MTKKIFTALLIILISSCCGTKGPRIKAGFVPRVNLVDFIFKSLDESIFFAGPVFFKQEQGKDKIQMDFTTVVKNKLCDSVRCSFTVFTKTPGEPLQKISLITTDTTISKTDLNVLYKDSNKKKYKYRYTFFITYSEYLKILDTVSPSIKFTDAYSFSSTRSWKRDAKEMKKKLGWLISGYL